MKKLLFLISLIFALQGFAQDKTENHELKDGATYIYISVTGEDTLTSNQDTIDYVIKYQTKEYINKVALHVGVDTIAGADTLTVELLGYDFLEDATANTIIAAATTNLASTAEIILTDDYSAAADEFSFRYYAIRIIRTGEGEGVNINEIEFKLYTE